MSWYNLALTLHIVGVLALCGAIALELVGIWLLRRVANVGQVGDVGNVLRHLDKVFGSSGGLILLSGVFMTVERMRRHDSIAWAVVSLILFILMAVSGAITGKKTGEAMAKAMSGSHGRMTPEIARFTRRNPSQFNAAFGPWVVVGIVSLMVYKPDAIISTLILLASLVVGYTMHRQLFVREPAKGTASQAGAQNLGVR